MIDEGELRRRFPEIPWDQPERITITGDEGTSFYGWVCRYCVAMKGLKGAEVVTGLTDYCFELREHCLDHIEEVHHD